MSARSNTMLQRLGFNDKDRREPLHDLACQYLAQEAHARRLLEMAVAASWPDAPGPEIATLLLSERKQEWGHWEDYEASEVVAHIDEASVEIASIDATVEMPISKGEGQYKTTIGFCDLAIRGSLGIRWVGEVARRSWHKQLPPRPSRDGEGPYWKREHAWYEAAKTVVPTLSESIEHRGLVRLPPDGCGWDKEDWPMGALRAAVEVKAGRPDLHDLIRQVNLYREYDDCWAQVLGRRSDPVVWFVAFVQPYTAREAAVLRDAGITPIRLGEGFTRWVEEQRVLDAKDADVDMF